MSEFSDYMYVDCIVDIQCAGCGDVEDASGGSEREACRNLAGVLNQSGWKIVEGVPMCRECAEATDE